MNCLKKYLLKCLSNYYNRNTFCINVLTDLVEK